MNKRITSLLLCFLLVFSMLSVNAEHTHAISKPTVSMEASAATVNAGDEVEITIYFQSPIDTVGGQLSVVMPEGITIVSCNLDENRYAPLDAMDALGMEDGDVDWLPESNQIFFTGFAPLTNVKNAPVAVAVLKCKVDENAASGTYHVSFTTTIDGIVGQGGIGNGTGDMLATSEYDLVGADIQVVGKAVAIDSITLDASELELEEGETATLTATINPANYSEGFAWSTDDAAVASINGETVTVTITAGKAGTANVTIASKDGGKSATCVVTVTCKHEWSTTLVNTDAAGHYNECTKCGEQKNLEAHSAADDGNCATADVCSCGYTVRAAGEHTPEADDGDCQTPVSCKNCDQIAVAAKTHVAGADDGDCTTAVLCANEGCKAEVIAAKDAHVAGEDDGDCTTAVKCANCDKNAVEAEKDHTPGEDDGDCTTAVKCTKCDKDAVAAKDAHVAGEDDGDCTTAVKCAHCDQEVVAAKQHDFSGEWQNDKAEGHYHTCGNEGCDKADAFVEHVPGPEATPSTPQVCTECGYELVPATNKFVKAVNATVEKPVLGKKPNFNPSVKGEPADCLGEVTVVWHVIAEENYTNTDADVWEVMDPEAVFEAGYIYSCDIIANIADGYEIDTELTVTVNGKAHNNAFGDANQGEYVYLCGVFKPVDPNNPATGDNSNMMLWITMLVLSGAGVIGAFAYDKKKKRA